LLKKRLVMKRVIALLVSATAGCATVEPVVRLQPTDRDVVWRSGRAIVTRESSAVRVAAAFDRQRGERIGIRLEVQNLSLPRLDFDPGQVTYQRCSPMGKCSPWWRVADPEAALIALDARRGEERAAAEDSQAVWVGLLLLDVISGVGLGVSGNSRQVAHIGDGIVADVTLGEASAARHEANVVMIDAERESWEAAALRRTTLFPSQGLAGSVYLPIVDDTVAITLRVQVADQTFVFPFTQTTLRAE